MDPGYFTILGMIVIGLAYGLYRARRPPRRSRAGWVALAILATLVAGLVIASQTGHETLTWVFGLGLMLVTFCMMFLAIGAAIGSRLGRRRD